MVPFQKNDVVLDIQGRAYILRLTLGVLAEIDEVLSVNGPLELAAKMKLMSTNTQGLEEAQRLLKCVLRPAFVEGELDLSILAKQAVPKEFMSAITRLFEMNFRGMST